jgi:hypothetical protein
VKGCVGTEKEERTEETLLAVLQLEVLIGELVAVDGLATSAVALCEITTLDHEVLDDTVEGGALVTKALLASSKSSEVLGSLLTRKHDEYGARAGHVATLGTVLP